MIYPRSQSQYKAKLRFKATCLWVYQGFSTTSHQVSLYLIYFLLNLHLTPSVEWHYAEPLTEQINNLENQSTNGKLGQWIKVQKTKPKKTKAAASIPTSSLEPQLYWEGQKQPKPMLTDLHSKILSLLQPAPAESLVKYCLVRHMSQMNSNKQM